MVLCVFSLTGRPLSGGLRGLQGACAAQQGPRGDVRAACERVGGVRTVPAHCDVVVQPLEFENDEFPGVRVDHAGRGWTPEHGDVVDALEPADDACAVAGDVSS